MSCMVIQALQKGEEKGGKSRYRIERGFLSDMAMVLL